MKRPKRLKQLVRKGLLRGPLLSWWTDRKFRKIEDHYLSEAIKASSIPVLPSQLPQKKARIRRIAFIGDIMWEANFLIPELARIAPTDALDLRPHLARIELEGDLQQAIIKAVRSFLEEFRGREPDVLLLYARSPLLSEELFDLLRRHWHCPILGMQLDDKVNFLEHGIFADRNDNYVKWARHFDVNLTNCLVVSDWYKQRGLPVSYFPQGFLNEELSPPALSSTYRYEMSFVGSVKPDRERIVSRLKAAGVPIRLFGKGWPDAGWVKSPTTIYRESQINLGIGYATPALTTIKGRDFECPGVGACYLTTYNWELSNWFEIGKEILLYREVEELIEIFSYYRSRPEECAKIALAAYKRCIAEHTWEKRFRNLFAELGLLPQCPQ